MNNRNLKITVAKRQSGFSLIELMITIAIAGIIITSLVQLYGSVFGAKAEAAAKASATVTSSSAFLQLVYDIQRSGSFGCFNARIVGTISGAESIPALISGIGKFDTTSAGLIAYSPSSIPVQDTSVFNEYMQGTTGYQLSSNSEILRVQFGYRNAFISGYLPLSGTSLTQISFSQPTYQSVSTTPLTNTGIVANGIATVTSSSSLYALASCNRLDEIQGAISGNSLAVSGIPFPGTTNAHNTASWRLMNFTTRYYYVAQDNGVQGLYSKYILPNGSLSSSQLVIKGVTQLNYSFAVESNNVQQMKVTSAMQTINWPNINQVVISMRLQTVNNTTLNGSALSESVVQSVSVLKS